MSLTQPSAPLCIVIDLDGTIIGDITPQIMTFELGKSLKQAHVKNIFDLRDLKAKLKSGLLRPYFDTFIKTITYSKPTVEFFVYTASEKSWAELVIKCIEQVIGIKFNRPIFSRGFCVLQDREYKKSIKYIKPAIAKCLKKKYGVSFGKNELASNILLIDNNNVYSNSDAKNLLVCPTYNYRIPENVVANIKLDIFKQHAMVITAVLRRHIPLSQTTNYNHFQRDFYTYYLNYLTTSTKKNSHYSQDKFWMHMRDIIMSHNVKMFDEYTVKYITNSLRQRMPITSANTPASPSIISRLLPGSQSQLVTSLPAKGHRVDALKRTFF